MTRETKLGLLVGLAFLLVVGILLSDHVSSAARPPEAPLENAAHDVKLAMRSPQEADVAPVFELQPELKAMTQAMGPATDSAARPPVVEVPAPTGDLGDGLADNLAAMAGIFNAAESLPASVDDDSPWNGQFTSAPVETAADEAMTAPVAVEVAREAAPQLPTQAEAVQAVPVQDYTVQAGDSLSKLAARFCGGSSPAHQQQIIALNPSLKQDPDKLLLGQTYRVPATAATAPKTEATPAKVIAGKTYTVQPGDSLWKIATSVCGDAGLLDELRELNATQLKGTDTVRPGMELVLPKKD